MCVGGGAGGGMLQMLQFTNIHLTLYMETALIHFENIIALFFVFFLRHVSVTLSFLDFCCVNAFKPLKSRKKAPKGFKSLGQNILQQSPG